MKFGITLPSMNVLSVIWNSKCWIRLAEVYDRSIDNVFARNYRMNFNHGYLMLWALYDLFAALSGILWSSIIMIRAPHFHLTAHRIPYRCIVACLFVTSNNFSYMKDFNSRKLITATNPIESYCTVESTHIILIIHGFFWRWLFVLQKK